MIVYAPEESEEEPFNMAIDDTSEDPTIVVGKLVTTAFVSDDLHIQTEKVGCLQITSQLQEFLNHFPPEPKEKAFEQIYQILQALDAYLIDNLQQYLCRVTTRPPRSSSTAECLRLIARLKRGTGIYGLLGTSATV